MRTTTIMTSRRGVLARFFTTSTAILFASIVLSGCAAIGTNEAKEYTREAIQHAEAGYAAAEAERYAEAEAEFSAAIDLMAKAYETCENAQGIFQHCVQDETAHQTVMQGLYRDRGRVRYYLGDNQGAISDLEYAVEAFPKAEDTLPGALYYLAMVEFLVGNRNKANEAYERLKKLDPEKARKLLKELEAVGRQ